MERQEAEAVLTLSLMAAFADGTQAEEERQRVKEIMNNLGLETSPAILQRVVMKQVTLEETARLLASPETRALAYEMSVYVCEADGTVNTGEQHFLEELRSNLGIAGPAAANVQRGSAAVVATPAAVEQTPLAVEPKDLELDPMILKYAVLTGALELLPQSLATMAIIPIQIRMVYRVGVTHGVSLDKGHIKEFLATVGVGMTAQMVEGMARRVLGQLGRTLGGGLFGMATDAVTGSALTFGTTYALGQVAKTYYAGGRTLTMDQLKALFQRLLGEGKALFTSHQGEVQSRAQTLNLAEVLPLLKN
jgi:tellurite resistance protein/uncharacterized protein (DUF697 family)